MTSTDELDQLWRDGLAALADQPDWPINWPSDPEQRVAIRLRRRRRRRTATKVSVISVVGLGAVAAITIAALVLRPDHAVRITSPPASVPAAVVAVEEAPGGSLTIAFPGRDFTGNPPAIRLPSGLVRFQVVSGGAGHALVLDGPSGFRVQLTSASTPSKTTDVQLAPGEYLMHCIVPGHTEAGEQARLTVATP